MTPEQINILWGYLGAVVYVLFAIGIALVFYKMGLSKKYTRKIVHILVGFEWVILSHFFGASYHFLIVCVVFTAALALSYFKHLLPAMSSDGENDPGTVYYGVSMTVMATVCLFLPDMMLPFGIGVFCTSLGDGFAGIVGQLVRGHNPKIFRNKSLLGTLTNLAVSFGVVLAFKYIYAIEALSVVHCIYIAIFSAGLELIGAFGLDNLMITLGTAALSYALIAFPEVVGYVAPIITAPYIVALVIEKRALTSYGLFAALLLDIVVALAFGNLGFFVLISFFVGALAVDKVKKARRREDTITKKEGTRDLVQVVANGLIPMVMACLFVFWSHPAFLVAFVATMAEAFADTAASGMGVFSRTTYDIFKMKKCECGISGGVSLIGTLASLAASALLSLYLFALGLNISWIFFLISFATAFLGVVFDSFLGSLFQIKFRCSECGKITERHTHCDKPTAHAFGFAFFDNDVVNLLSGAFTAVVAVAVCLIIL